MFETEPVSPPRGIDLHTHSSCSDGVLSPEALVAMAADGGVHALALTDHDTMEGVARAEAEGRRRGIEVIPGVEFSCDWAGSEVHLLGYYLSPGALTDPLLPRLRRLRAERVVAIRTRLAALGVDPGPEALPQHGALGRPHVARALVAAGKAKSVKDAFNRWLGDSGPAFVAKHRLPLDDGIAFIRAWGGVPVLAHPGAPNRFPLLPDVIARGLAGLEVYHPRHSADQAGVLLQLCKQYDLAPTGGSDFHEASESRSLGRPYVPPEWLSGLKAKAVPPSPVFHAAPPPPPSI